MGKLVWLGHSCFYVVLDGKKILIDPWLTNPVAPKELPSLDDVDLVAVTHWHGDHVGEAADVLKKSKQAKLVAVYEAAQRFVEEEGVPEEKVVGCNIGGPVEVAGVKVALTPAAHSSACGCPTGVVLIGREATIYHAGDTGVFYDMQLIGELYRPDIALLPIGGHFTMDPLQAAYAVKLIKPKVAIPMHYGTFPVLYGRPEDFAKEVQKLRPETKVVVLEPGKPYEF